MKRNRLSGYDIMFLNSPEEPDNDNGMGQEELEEIFFTDLERVAGSNIRLSLIYWLQSVQSVGEEGIKVSRFFVPDFDWVRLWL